MNGVMNSEAKVRALKQVYSALGALEISGEQAVAFVQIRNTLGAVINSIVLEEQNKPRPVAEDKSEPVNEEAAPEAA